MNAQPDTLMQDVGNTLAESGITFDHLNISEGRCQIEVYCRRYRTLKRQLERAGYTDIDGSDCKSYRISDAGEAWNWMALAHFPVQPKDVPATPLPALSPRLQQAFERAQRMVGGAA